ncbi:hypothetical protein BJ742DRAFT_821302 [Cladochytrium replicatum]|nr:hypothetical protein BJ742DRAFT_821302 [Cladochytrium replicatum]
MVTKATTQRGRRKRTSCSGATSSSAAVSPAERRRSASDAVAKIRRQAMSSDSGHSSEEEKVADKTLVNFSLGDNESFDHGDDSENGRRKQRGNDLEELIGVFESKFKRKSFEKEKKAGARASQKLTQALDNVQQLFGDSQQKLRNLNASLKSKYDEQFEQQEARIKRQKVHIEKTVQNIKQLVGKLESDMKAAEQIQRQFDQQFQSEAKIHEEGLHAVSNAIVADLNAERKKAHRSVRETFDPNASVKTLQLMLTA